MAIEHLEDVVFPLLTKKKEGIMIARRLKSLTHLQCFQMLENATHDQYHKGQWHYCMFHVI